MNFVILAGGSGTRLWPMSRSSSPKQLTRLVTDVTMIEDTIARLKGIATEGNLYISTNAQFAPIIRDLVPSIPDDHYIIEPEKRDTGPAMAFVAAWLNRTAPDEPMVFLPSDHFIRDPKLFRDTFVAAEAVIRETGKLLDIGITPTFANTHLGYTKVGQLVEHRNGIHFYEFAGHAEKPDYETARRFLDEGNYLWHANYYMWTPKKFVEAYQEYAPSIGDQLAPIAEALDAGDDAAVAECYGKMEKISIDYAIAEKIDPGNVLIIRGDFGWADLGSWDMLYDELAERQDEQGNLVKANWHGAETTNSLVYGSPDKVIATLGLDGLVIVDTPDALLVTTKGRARDLKTIIELLKAHGADNVL